MGEYTEQNPLRLIELFAGIGSQTQALTNIGVPHTVVGISEIDKYAIQSYEAMHGAVHNFGDIRQIKSLPDADLWTYSFPCQDISVAGKGAGIKEGTRSGLLFEVERLLNAAAENGNLPKYLLLENVKNLVSKKFKADFDRWLNFLSSLGYTNYWQILNAKDYGIPQNRERVFCVSIRGEHSPFKFPGKKELKLRLRDMIDEVVDEKYYLKENTIRSIINSSFNSRRDSIKKGDEIANTLMARDFKGPQCVQVGEVVGGKWDKMHDISRRVYEPDGISPTVHCQQGGNTELKIVAMRGRNPDNPSDRSKGAPLEQRLEPNEQGICNSLTTVQKDNLVLEQKRGSKEYVARRYKEFIKEKGYIPEMFVAYNKQEVDDIAPTITGQCSCPSGSSAVLKLETDEVKVLAPNNWGHKAGDGTATRERRETDIVPALQANAGQTQQSYLKIKVATKQGYEEAESGDYVNITFPSSKTKRGRVGKGVAQTLTCGDGNAVITENVRIRKLTPRECLRLMGWNDEQIDKIQSANVSATQQYRQAGNGIVVQVLEAIFKALFLGAV
ncbi:MAG: DNA (cytosine-5-)-methyltransferase [Muribaculaceae bacterium]|nr:DNA (cytosine-5-)-methyltransferase [Muribaculaceae bacterium]